MSYIKVDVWIEEVITTTPVIEFRTKFRANDLFFGIILINDIFPARKFLVLERNYY